MNPKTDKLVRRTTMVATATASYFLLTADYGPEPNILDPESVLQLLILEGRVGSEMRTKGLEVSQNYKIKAAIKSTERSVKEFIFGPDK